MGERMRKTARKRAGKRDMWTVKREGERQSDGKRVKMREREQER